LRELIGEPSPGTDEGANTMALLSGASKVNVPVTTSRNVAV